MFMWSFGTNDNTKHTILPHLDDSTGITIFWIFNANNTVATSVFDRSVRNGKHIRNGQFFAPPRRYLLGCTINNYNAYNWSIWYLWHIFRCCYVKNANKQLIYNQKLSYFDVYLQYFTSKTQKQFTKKEKNSVSVKTSLKLSTWWAWLFVANSSLDKILFGWVNIC